MGKESRPYEFRLGVQVVYANDLFPMQPLIVLGGPTTGYIDKNGLLPLFPNAGYP